MRECDPIVVCTLNVKHAKRASKHPYRYDDENNEICNNNKEMIREEVDADLEQMRVRECKIWILRNDDRKEENHHIVILACMQQHQKHVKSLLKKMYVKERAFDCCESERDSVKEEFERENFNI